MLEKEIILELKKIRNSICLDIQKVNYESITQVMYGNNFREFRESIRDILPINSDEYVKFNGKYLRITEWLPRIKP